MLRNLTRVEKNLTLQAKIVVASVKHCAMICSLTGTKSGF